MYVNTIALQLPSSLGTLTAAELREIADNHGSPYTGDYNNVFGPLRPRAVENSLEAMARDVLQSLSDSLVTNGVEPSHLTLRQIADALYGRPNTDPGGPTAFKILEALMQTNTMSYEDFSKIATHMHKHTPASGKVEIAYFDGQGVIGFKNAKKAFPHQYARFLIGVGGFHEHAHTLFAFTEMFDAAIGRFTIDFLHPPVPNEISRVQKVTNNLEHNAYRHHQNAHHVRTLAFVAYLLQDVVNPPPRLLLQRGLDAYQAHVETAGGIVMLEYLRGAGFPAIQWQRCARGGTGRFMVELFAYSLHIYRSVCHKPVAAQVALIAILGFECCLPALRAVLFATTSLSLLGRSGANMYIDRVLEYVNNIQQGSKGNSSAASFGKALDMTTLLRPMMHVRHAFQATEAGSADGDDPITQSMLIQARLLQDEIRRILGTDLTLVRPNNPFHHTGNAVPLDGGSLRERQPWEFWKRVAHGRSTGKGRSRLEAWSLYVRRFVFDHFFRF